MPPWDGWSGPLDLRRIGADQDIAGIRDAVGHEIGLPAPRAGPGAEDGVVVAVRHAVGIGQRG